MAARRGGKQPSESGEKEGEALKNGYQGKRSVEDVAEKISRVCLVQKLCRPKVCKSMTFEKNVFKHEVRPKGTNALKSSFVNSEHDMYHYIT